MSFLLLLMTQSGGGTEVALLEFFFTKYSMSAIRLIVLYFIYDFFKRVSMMIVIVKVH